MRDPLEKVRLENRPLRSSNRVFVKAMGFRSPNTQVASLVAICGPSLRRYIRHIIETTDTSVLRPNNKELLVEAGFEVEEIVATPSYGPKTEIMRPHDSNS